MALQVESVASRKQLSGGMENITNSNRGEHSHNFLINFTYFCEKAPLYETIPLYINWQLSAYLRQ